MRILVAEDDAVTRKLLDQLLRQRGYEVVLACDGEEAWQQLQGPDAPPIAILDWSMPNQDGVTIARRVRNLPGPRLTYMILLSGNEHPQEITLGLQAGADDYLTKPFYRADLHARVEAAALTVEGWRRTQTSPHP